MQQLYDAITEEQALYQKRKAKLMVDVEKILSSDQVIEAKKNQQLQLVSDKSFSDLNELKNLATSIDNQVRVVQVAANKTMQNFQSLRTQKKNVENILNTLSAFLELKRIHENLPQAISDQNIEKCLRLAQSFQSIENLLIKEFCGQDFANVKKLIDIDLVELQKTTFETALKDNDINLINSCACLAKVLKIEGENSLEKVQKVHGNELKQKLLALEEEMFEKNPQALTEDYELPYLWHFVRILEKINDQSETFAENIISFYGKDGFNQFAFYMIENISHPFMHGIFKRINQFFKIDFKEEQQQQQQQQHQSGLVQCLSNQKFDDQEILKLSLFCEEISAISGQFQQFIAHIGSLTSDPTTLFDSLSIQNILMDSLAKFVQCSQKELSQQLAQLIQKSESLHSLWHFDKNKIQEFAELKEPLTGNGLHEWLEEIFFIIKNKIKRSISTENQMIASAVINHIGYCVISEDLFQVTLQLINRYLKKEYFSSNAIGFNNKYTVHNAFMILLINIVSSIPKYLKSLKSQVYQELQGSQSNMIVGAIEEMVESNEKKFSKLSEDKLRSLAEYLKSTVKFLFDDVRSLNFCGNENVMVEQEREYSKLFSQQFRTVLGSSLEQWREQLSRENYEQVMIYLCENVSKNLEQIIMSKQFHQMGGIIVEKEMRSIINFFARWACGCQRGQSDEREREAVLPEGAADLRGADAGVGAGHGGLPGEQRDRGVVGERDQADRESEGGREEGMSYEYQNIFKMKQIRVMDTAMLIKGFILDVTNTSSLFLPNQSAEQCYFLNSNKYFHFGCLTISLGLAFSHFLRYRIKWSKKFTIKNITKFINRRKEAFSMQRLEQKDTDTFMLRIFMNGMGLILLPSQARVSFVLLNLSSVFSLVQLMYKSYIYEQYHVTSMLRFTGGLFSFIALSEACIFARK